MTSDRPYAEVIGDPIEHSLSPVIHSFWLEALGIEAAYRRRRVTRAELPAYVGEVRADREWRGSNVTMPLKLDALALADDASDHAIAAGAANVLLLRGRTLHAANTDVGAIAGLLERARKAGRRLGSVTLLGNGGAARAALVALKLLGIDQVRIQARDLAAAVKLAVEFGLAYEPEPLTARIESDALINATPLGMPGIDCLNCDVSRLPADGLVFDFVSNPARTPLIDAAAKRGLAVISGVELLVEQAAASFELFFGATPPRNRDAELMKRLAA